MELKTYFDILVRRRRIALLVALATAIVVAAGTLFVAPRYQAQAMLRIVTPLGGTSGETNYQTTFASRLMNTYAHIATSDEVTTQLKTKLGLKTLPLISVWIVPDSEIIQIVVESSNAELAAKTANGLADLLLAYQGSAESPQSAGNLDVLAKRKLDLEAQLAAYEQKHDQLLQTYSETAADIAVLDGTIRMKQGAYQSLQNQYEQAVVSNAVFTSLTSRATKDALSNEMQNLQTELDSLNQQYKNLSQSSNEYLQQITLVRQNIQSIQADYSSLLAQYDAVSLANSRQQDAQRITIISRPGVPTQRSGPGSALLFALTIGCGLIAGIITAFVADNLDPRVFAPEQISALTGAPILGTISRLADPQQWNPAAIEQGATQSSWMPAVRLQSLIQEAPFRTILVTSPNPGEGRSATTYLLALGLAQNHRKVLVVDANLQKPVQHRLFQVMAEQGLYEFLNGDEDDLDRIILKNVKPDVDLLPNVTETASPTELMQSPRMRGLFGQLKGYDVVLIDGPAFLPSPDAVILAGETDRMIITAELGHTAVNEIQAVCNFSEEIRSKVVGIVVNQSVKRNGIAGLFRVRSPKRTDMRVNVPTA